MFICKLKPSGRVQYGQFNRGPILHCSSPYIFNGASPKLWDKYRSLSGGSLGMFSLATCVTSLIALYLPLQEREKEKEAREEEMVR